MLTFFPNESCPVKVTFFPLLLWLNSNKINPLYSLHVYLQIFLFVTFWKRFQSDIHTMSDLALLEKMASNVSGSSSDDDDDDSYEDKETYMEDDEDYMEDDEEYMGEENYLEKDPLAEETPDTGLCTYFFT